MSAMSFARQAFAREKPHTSITGWIDVLTGPNIAEEAYDGIPELVDAINIQPHAGPTEASRALRKKLKHGNAHQQYRSLVLLKALVENCGDKFKSSFADDQLTDVLKQIAANLESQYSTRVQKKMKAVLLSWREQFKDDPSMKSVASLYDQFKRESRWVNDIEDVIGLPPPDAIKKQKRREEREAKEREARQAKERLEEQERQQRRSKRPPFNFEKEKPKVQASIVDASQASSNLVNAIRLVNREKETLQENERVQDCLDKAKQVRRQIVRYIQLVEDEDFIGTLIESNDHIMSALEMYDQILLAAQEAAVNGLASDLAGTHVAPETEVSRLQEKQRAAVERAKQASMERLDDSEDLHPDLQDLNFGSIEGSANLPAPLKPSNRSSKSDDGYDHRGSLSDYSDYESSDEETHNTAGPSRRRAYVNVSSDEDDEVVHRAPIVSTPSGDPFADPFADEGALGPKK